MIIRTPRLVALGAAGALVAAGLVGGGWWLDQRDDGSWVASGGAPTTAPAPTDVSPSAPGIGLPAPNPPGTTTTKPAPPRSDTPVGTWRRLPAAPALPGSFSAAGVWTGTELLMYGPAYDSAGLAVGTGLAYHPTTGRWRRITSAPGPVESVEGGYHAVWTGRELLGWGVGLNAAYNPVTKRWRPLAGSVAGPSVMVWTGRQVLTWGGGCCGANLATGGAYTPATDTWRALPRSPLTGRHTTGAWTGRELVIVGGSGEVDVNGRSEFRIFRDAAAYNPDTRTWRRLPPMPEPRTGMTATWTGRELLVVGGYAEAGHGIRTYADGVAYNPATNRWRRVPSMGIDRAFHSAVWTGRYLLVWGGRMDRAGEWTTPSRGVAYDPVRNTWTALPRSPLAGRTGHVAVWTGSQMLIWGGYPVRANAKAGDGAAYTLNPV